MRSRSCLLRNCTTMSSPNVKETPRSFSPQPMISRSGSDHRRSQSRPAKQPPPPQRQERQTTNSGMMDQTRTALQQLSKQTKNSRPSNGSKQKPAIVPTTQKTRDLRSASRTSIYFLPAKRGSGLAQHNATKKIT